MRRRRSRFVSSSTAGLPIWLYYLGTSASIVPTSVLTHIGGFIIGYAGMKKLGLPRGTWLVAIVATQSVSTLASILAPSTAHAELLLFVSLTFWLAGGMLYINSGYGALGGRPGNVLLAFGVP